LNNSDSSLKWIEAGYELFAHEGRDGLIIEKLARQLGKNKSGLYHHFGDPEIFFSELIKYHFVVIEQFCKEASQLQKFNPDYFNLLIRFKTSSLVQMQLRRRMDIPLYKETFHKVRKKTEKTILPLWSSYIKITDNPSLSQQLWDILRDLFFMRLNVNNMSLEFVQELVEEYLKIIEMIKRLSILPK
jgi:AcrR family transcriptional regulator